MSILNFYALLFSLSTVYTTTCESAMIEDAIQQELFHRIVALEKRDKDNAVMIIAQNELIQKLESKLGDQDATIRDYKERLAKLEHTVSKSQKDQALEQPGDHRKDREKTDSNDEIVSKVVGLRGDKMRQDRALVNGEGNVAFHAIRKAGGQVDNIGVGQNIVFPDVLTNIGSGFHPLHSVFIAPRAGIYIFSASITASGDAAHHNISVHLMKNGKVLANWYANGESGGNGDQGSVTVVTRLAVGDEMWVSLYAPVDASYWGNSMDSFMGCLITPE